jgi:hypothetical protein
MGDALDPRPLPRGPNTRSATHSQRLSLVINFVNISPFCSRSRFLVKVVGTQTVSSGESPTNQR